MYSTDYNSLNSLFVSFGLLFIGLLIVFLVCIILVVAGKVALYKKAGKKGWEAIIPFYSDYVYTEIASLNWWWFLIVLAPTIVSMLKIKELVTISYIASAVGYFFCNYNISKKLHKDTGFAVLMTLFPVIMLPLVGFSSSYQWDDGVKVSKNGLIGKVDESNNSNEGTVKEEETAKNEEAITPVVSTAELTNVEETTENTDAPVVNSEVPTEEVSNDESKEA